MRACPLLKVGALFFGRLDAIRALAGGMRSPFSTAIVSSRNLTLVHRREHINEFQSGTT
jgi:hypothetical protein